MEASTWSGSCNAVISSFKLESLCCKRATSLGLGEVLKFPPWTFRPSVFLIRDSKINNQRRYVWSRICKLFHSYIWKT